MPPSKNLASLSSAGQSRRLYTCHSGGLWDCTTFSNFRGFMQVRFGKGTDWPAWVVPEPTAPSHTPPWLRAAGEDPNRHLSIGQENPDRQPGFGLYHRRARRLAPVLSLPEASTGLCRHIL